MPKKSSKAPVDLLPATRAAILFILKHNRRATIQQIARELSLSNEAVRLHLAQMQHEGWILEECPPFPQVEDEKGRGRPPAEYCLSPAGDDLFPKQYSQLSGAMFDAIVAARGMKELIAVLQELTDARVEKLRSSTRRGSPEHSVHTFRALYVDRDPFISVERTEEGPAVIEQNCPYLTVALEHPAICSTTVSTLQRLTGREVIREERFQDNDGRCVFQVYEKRRLKRIPRFQWEKPRTPR